MKTGLKVVSILQIIFGALTLLLGLFLRAGFSLREALQAARQPALSQGSSD